jgi:hypothetical protein
LLQLLPSLPPLEDMFWDASQLQQKFKEEDKFSISSSISLDNFNNTESYLYNLLPKLLVIDFRDLNFLD